MINDLMSRAEAAERLQDLSASASDAVRAPADLTASVLHRARRRHRLRRTALGVGTGIAVLATAAAVSLGRGDYFTVTQPSAVMEPTIAVGEGVVFSRVTSPQLGDVVYAHVSDQGVEFDMMSRVLAQGGDTVSCPAEPDGRCDGVVLNGTPITDPYLQDLGTRPFPRTVVPGGEVFLLGDHRGSANDSRYVGTVPVEDISGVAVEIVGSDGDTRPVPGAPSRPGPDGDQIIDPAEQVPPASQD